MLGALSQALVQVRELPPGWAAAGRSVNPTPSAPSSSLQAAPSCVRSVQGLPQSEPNASAQFTQKSSGSVLDETLLAFPSASSAAR